MGGVLQHYLILAAFLGTALAGCAGTTEPVEEAAEPAAAPEPDEITGSITGTISSDEGLPINGARIAVVEVLLEAVSDKQGQFTINAVEPGDYTLLVDRLGYESTGKKISVAAEQVTTVDIQLTALVIPQEPYYQSQVRTSFIQISNAWIMYAQRNVNTSQGNDLTCTSCVHGYPYTNTDLEDVAIEGTWDASQTTATVINHEIWVRLWTDWTNEVGSLSPGNIVLNTYIQNGELVPKSTWFDGGFDQAQDADVLVMDIGGDDDGINLNHRFDIWMTFGYVDDLPDEFTALPPQ